jgi:hypothetical protein
LLPQLAHLVEKLTGAPKPHVSTGFGFSRIADGSHERHVGDEEAIFEKECPGRRAIQSMSGFAMLNFGVFLP